MLPKSHGGPLEVVIDTRECPAARDCNAQQLILTHYSARYPHSQVFEDEARQTFPNSYAAHDLKVFDWK